MKSRRQSREAALQVLYQCDTMDSWNLSDLNSYFDIIDRERSNDLSEILSANYDFARELVTGVLTYRDTLDKTIQAASEKWSLNRMTRVDRNILRIAAFEMLHHSDTPPRVIINEAVEIAKLFGSDNSHQFINGILDGITQQSTKASAA